MKRKDMTHRNNYIVQLFKEGNTEIEIGNLVGILKEKETT